MDQTALIYSLMGGLAGVVVTLGSYVWNSTQKQIQANSDAHKQQIKEANDAIEKKASADALRETKMDFARHLEKHQDEIAKRFHEINVRQEKEIDSIKDRMDKLDDNLAEMRKENNTANNNIMTQLNQLILKMGNKS